MVNRRGFMAGAAALLVGGAFSRSVAAQEQDASASALMLKNLHPRGPRNFYFNVAEQGYEAAFKQHLADITSYDAVNTVLDEQWDAYKDAMKEAVLGFMPQLTDDEATLKTLGNPGNFRAIRADDARRYNESGIQRSFPKNTATNPLYFRLRELAEAGVMTAAQSAQIVSAIDNGAFYKAELPAFISEQAGLVLAAPAAAKKVPVSPRFN